MELLLTGSRIQKWQLQSEKWMRNKRPNCHLEATIPISADLMTRQNGIYKCGKCDYQILNYRRMLEHTTKHTGVNTFLCRGCEQTFTTFRQLVGHIRKEH